MKTILTPLSRIPALCTPPHRAWIALCLGGALVLFLGETPGKTTASGTSPRVVAPAGIPLWSLDPGQAPKPNSFPRKVFRIPVTVTGYSSTPDQTDDTPYITAANTRVRPGIIALSRDLLREFTPGAPFGYGDRLEIEGVGSFLVEDTMNPRYTQRADIWFSTRTAARRWGVRRLTAAGLGRAAQEQGELAQNSVLPLFEEALSD
jgi:3D (Asp-Asp-Asp) domain-containing protein